jgi:hypothetical protein
MRCMDSGRNSHRIGKTPLLVPPGFPKSAMMHEEIRAEGIVTVNGPLRYCDFGYTHVVTHRYKSLLYTKQGDRKQIYLLLSTLNTLKCPVTSHKPLYLHPFI